MHGSNMAGKALALAAVAMTLLMSACGGGGESTVVNSPPAISSFTASPNPALPNQTVAFSAVASDPEGPIASYKFDFGDGSQTQVGASSTANHSYAAAGTYNTTVTVTDGAGLTATKGLPVVVTLVSNPLVPLSSVPFGNETNVNVATKISVTFDDSLDPASVGNGSVVVKTGVVEVAGTIALDPGNDKKLVFTPSAALEFAKTYTVTVSAAIKSVFGTALGQDYVYSFSTEGTSERQYMTGQVYSRGKAASASKTGDGTLYLVGDWVNGSFVSSSFLYRVDSTGAILPNWAKSDSYPIALAVKAMPSGGAKAVYRSSTANSLVIVTYNEAGDLAGAGRKEVVLGSEYNALGADIAENGVVYAVVKYSPLSGPAEVFVQPIDQSGNLMNPPSESLLFSSAYSILVTPSHIFVAGYKGTATKTVQVARMPNTGGSMGSAAPATYPPSDIAPELDLSGTYFVEGTINIASSGGTSWVSVSSNVSGKGYVVQLDSQLAQVGSTISLQTPVVTGTPLKDETRSIAVDGSGNVLVGVTRLASGMLSGTSGAANHLTVIGPSLAQTQYPILYSPSGFGAGYVVDPQGGRSLESVVLVPAGGYLFGTEVEIGGASSAATLFRLDASYAPMLPPLP